MDLIGYEDLYTIDEYGNIYSKKMNKYRFLQKTRNGFYTVQLCNKGKKNSFYIHRLIALHYPD